MNIGYHHFHYRIKHAEKIIEEENNRLKLLVDRAVYGFGVLSVIVLFPQVFKIWSQKNASGLSLFSWVGILLGTIFWLTYGLIHKEKPIIVANLALASMDILIVLGILVFG